MVGLRKEYRKKLWIWVVVSGIILGILLAVLKLDEKLAKILVFAFLLATAIASLMVDYKLNKMLGERYRDITDKYLYVDDDKYIKEMTDLIGDSKERALQNIYNINMGAAYYSKGEYEKSRDFFEKVKGKKIRGSDSFIYWADLALVNFRMGDVEKGEKVYNDYLNEEFDLRKDDFIGGLFAVVDIFHLGYKGDLKEAGDLYHASRSRYDHEHYKKDFDYLWELFDGFGPKSETMIADNSEINTGEDKND